MLEFIHLTNPSLAKILFKLFSPRNIVVTCQCVQKEWFSKAPRRQQDYRIANALKVGNERGFVDIESFNTGVCSSAYVQAVTDCRLIIFNKKDWQELLDTIVAWEAIVHKMIAKALILKVERRSPLVTEDATERYLRFLEIYPNVVNRIPLSYVASYLGITQSSLSRIRKSIR